MGFPCRNSTGIVRPGKIHRGLGGHRLGACRDCKNCTNSAAVHAGRKILRATVAISTYGMSEAALAMRKKCRQCSHQMSLHGLDQVAGIPQPMVETQNDSGFKGRRWLSKPPARPIPPSAPPPASPAPEAMTTTGAAPVSVADELLKLAQLRDGGVLTQLEFEAEKAKLLG